MQIYSGSTSFKLSQKLAATLGVTLGQVELSQFPNHESRVWVKEDRVDKEVVVVQSFVGNPNQAIMEYALLVDALRRSGAKEITAVIPWMGYCIQDKIFRRGEPLSARVIADIIQATRPDKIITFDLHNDTIQGFFTIPVVHLSAVPLILDRLRRNHSIDVVVAPDVGALKESTEIAHNLEVPIVVLNKKRDRNTGEVQIVGVDGEIAGKKALIMDDFISTGGTMVQTANYLQENGVEKVCVGVTHHLFVPGAHQRLAKSGIDELFITDTVAKPSDLEEPKGLKLEVISVVDSLAEQLR